MEPRSGKSVQIDPNFINKAATVVIANIFSVYLVCTMGSSLSKGSKLFRFIYIPMRESSLAKNVSVMIPKPLCRKNKKVTADRTKMQHVIGVLVRKKCNKKVLQKNQYV